MLETKKLEKLIETGDLENVKNWFLENPKFEITESLNLFGHTALHRAAISGNKELIEWLITEKKSPCRPTR